MALEISKPKKTTTFSRKFASFIALIAVVMTIGFGLGLFVYVVDLISKHDEERLCNEASVAYKTKVWGPDFSDKEDSSNTNNHIDRRGLPSCDAIIRAMGSPSAYEESAIQETRSSATVPYNANINSKSEKPLIDLNGIFNGLITSGIITVLSRFYLLVTRRKV